MLRETFYILHLTHAQTRRERGHPSADKDGDAIKVKRDVQHPWSHRMARSRGQEEWPRKCPPAAHAGQSGRGQSKRLVKEQLASARLLSPGPPPLHAILPLSLIQGLRKSGTKKTEINIQEERLVEANRLRALLEKHRKQLKKKTPRKLFVEKIVCEPFFHSQGTQEVVTTSEEWTHVWAC